MIYVQPGLETETAAVRRVRIGEMAYQLDANSTLPTSPSTWIQFGLRLDPLRTLIIGGDAEASSVAGAVDAGDIKHIMVRDPEGAIAGIVVVDWAKEKVAQFLDPNVVTFQDAVEAIHVGGIRSGSYQHEWLTLDRPPLIYCRGGHWADADPCSRHKP